MLVRILEWALVVTQLAAAAAWAWPAQRDARLRLGWTGLLAGLLVLQPLLEGYRWQLWGLYVSGLQLRMAKPNRAPKQMQVAINETRQQCALLRIHHARGRPPELRAVFRAAHSHNARAAHRNRSRPRHNQVLREHPCV